MGFIKNRQKWTALFLNIHGASLQDASLLNRTRPRRTRGLSATDSAKPTRTQTMCVEAQTLSGGFLRSKLCKRAVHFWRLFRPRVDLSAFK